MRRLNREASRRDKRFVPFTRREVKNFNKDNSRYHAYTCTGGDQGKCARCEANNFGVLIAHTNGLVCPCGEYHQKWVSTGFLGARIKPKKRMQSKYIDIRRIISNKRRTKSLIKRLLCRRKLNPSRIYRT